MVENRKVITAFYYFWENGKKLFI